jgi:DNA-directed RNA polymerase subunit RPC12/RpoP
MIGICSQCGLAFEGTQEDTSTPGTLCPSCHARPFCSTYPDAGEVERATPEQLAKWHRFLPSPGEVAVPLDDRDEFERVLRWEAAILDRIEARFKEVGGMTPQLSKAIGWK